MEGKRKSICNKCFIRDFCEEADFFPNDDFCQSMIEETVELVTKLTQFIKNEWKENPTGPLWFIFNKLGLIEKERFDELKEKLNALEKKYKEIRERFGVLCDEKIPVGVFACMAKYWEPPDKCSNELKTGMECDQRRFCEVLSKLIDWEKGYRPKATTIRKFLCKYCDLLKGHSSKDKTSLSEFI